MPSSKYGRLSYPIYFLNSRGSIIRNSFLECKTKQSKKEGKDQELRYNITMHFSLKYVTFGITERAHCTETQDKKFFILLGKYYMFKNKCLKTQPTIAHFKVYLSQIINVEKHIYFIKKDLPNLT